jgi:DNA-directed RNA polymerase subunit RPC12/RpoP
MKCTRCGTDVRYRDRKDGKCDRCGGRFAFEPKRGDPFTDQAFKSALETVSGQARLRWGVEHLYWELARRRLKKARQESLGCSCLAGVAAAGSVFLSFASDFGFAWVAGLSLFLVAIGLWQRGKRGGAARNLPLERFNRLWERWCAAHGRPDTAILRERRKPRTPERDVYDYSFDRVVVCDRARSVDLLIANNFHFENNCAVLSIGGYPEAVFDPVRAMLKRNPHIEVFALHDATPFGCRVAHRLTHDPEWFPGRRVLDVGLRPRHVAKHEAYWLASEVRSVEAGGGLSTEEAAWLSRYQVELAIYRPEAILRALFRAINESGEMALAGTDGAGPSDGDDGFDSFG